ncbi:protein FAM8A1 isoform X2 [Arctopsyche grandis]|uniref:protein FAM8A1 isoform X2 n=1 Tax=Arctopsyche grandis TaxID=121162 RepID=UPI00406D8A04
MEEAKLEKDVKVSDTDANKNKQSDEEILAEKTKYFSMLRCWLYQMQMSQATAYLPYYLMSTQMPMQLQFQFQFQPTAPFLNNNYQHQGQWPYYQLMQNYQDGRTQPNANSPNAGRNIRPPTNTADGINRNGGMEFVVPPLWKRFVAEFLDFFFLFITKVFFTFIAVDYLDLIVFNTKTTTLHLLKQLTEDYDFAFEVTAEIFILELINRLGACFYEAVFLSDVLGGIPWGATPGKAVMGLRVVYATSVIPVENRARETVIVFPGTNLTFGVALLRSAVKNALITIVFPICMFTLFFQHNRTTYDVLCNVIVVEARIPLLEQRD